MKFRTSLTLGVACLLAAEVADAEPTAGDPPAARETSDPVLKKPPARDAAPAETTDNRDDPESSPPTDEDESPGALPLAAAVFPGVLLHGSGTWVAGRRKAGKRLAQMEGLGLGLVLLGGIPIALTGASRYLVGPLAAITITGFGLFLTSFAADFYGATIGDSQRGSAATWQPLLLSEAGWRHVYDPQFAYRNFAYQGFDLTLGRVRLSPSGWFALDHQNTRLRGEFAYRVMGPTPTRRARDGSFLELEAGMTRHDFWPEGFSSVTGEVSVSGRFDMERLDSELRGSFSELGAGIGLQRFSYEVGGLDGENAHDWTDMLLTNFAFGVYLPTRAPGSNARIYYAHRHDGYAAGLKLINAGSGVAGHFGVDSRFFLDEAWGIRLTGEVGSAWVGGVSVLFREVGSSWRTHAGKEFP